jgi:hypothetical protein
MHPPCIVHLNVCYHRLGSPSPSPQPLLGACEASGVTLLPAEQGPTRGVSILAQFQNLQTLQAYCPSQLPGSICQLVFSRVAEDTPTAYLGGSSASVSATCQQLLELQCTLTLQLPSDGRFMIQLQPQDTTTLACEPPAVSVEVSSVTYCWCAYVLAVPQLAEVAEYSSYVEVASRFFRQAVRVADGKGFGTGKMPGMRGFREGFVDRRSFFFTASMRRFG